MKRRNQRTAARFRRNQSTNAISHLTGGLVGEGDRQNCPSWNFVGANQMGDPVRDHARLAAARARQDEKRAFAMLHGFSLAWIEALKKVHHSIVARTLFLKAALSVDVSDSTRRV